MKIEHFAINVEQPSAMSQWYVENLHMKIVSQQEQAPYATFLSDMSGRVMIEVYNNPPDHVPDYENMNPLTLHLAFVSTNPGKDKERLLQAGAYLVSEDLLEDGSHLVMLRDPWGLSIQLCKRARPMLLDKELQGN